MEEEKKPNGLVRFFRFMWTCIKAYLIGIGLFVTLIPILIILVIGRSQDSSSLKISEEVLDKKKGYVIDLPIHGEVQDHPEELEKQLMRRLFGQQSGTSIADIRTTLRRAAKDERVKAVQVQISSAQATMNQCSELRNLFTEFRKSQKYLSFFLPSVDTYLYYLATAGEKIFAPPAAEFQLIGPIFFLTYFGDALKKLGVDFQVVRAGKFKSAFEPLVANAPSPETLEMYKTMEESLRARVIQDVAAERKKDVGLVKAWFEQSLFNPKGALSEGIVDALGFVEDQKTDADQHLAANNVAADRIEHVEMKKYLSATTSENLEKDITVDEDRGVALIVAEGEILLAVEDSGARDMITPDAITKELQWAGEDEDVASVVLRIDSPGGSATAADVIWQEVKTLAAKKPVVVSMGAVAASGGYYMAAPATKIIADPFTITGSIGVIGAIPKLEAFKEKYGVSFFVVTQSQRAGLLNPGQQASGFDKTILESTIDDVYKTFLSRVSEGRKMTMEQVDALAQGRVYTGMQALELKLVDDLGGLNEAFAKAKELASLDVNKLYPIHQYKGEGFDLGECLKGVSNAIECFNELESQSRTSEAMVLAKVARLKKLLGRSPQALALWDGYLSAVDAGFRKGQGF